MRGRPVSGPWPSTSPGPSIDVSYRELTQHYPRPGWVEHDAAEIWDSRAWRRWPRWPDAGTRPGDTVAAIGITNQRETVVAWDRATGRPLHRAIVWQDRRTAERCDQLRAEGHLPVVRERTGLVLDPYFSGTKMEWLLGPGGVEVTDDLVLATVDAWLIWNLTGGTDGGVLATDATNASRTLLYDIARALLVRRAVRHLRRAPRRAPRGAPLVRALRRGAGRARGPGSGRRRRARERRGRRPAGRPLRTGVRDARAWRRSPTGRGASSC